MVPVVLAAGVTVAVICSMYISFTPVGAHYINGVQFRYMIPLLLPVLTAVTTGKVQNRVNRGLYNGIILVIAAFVDFAMVYSGFIVRYY